MTPHPTQPAPMNSTAPAPATPVHPAPNPRPAWWSFARSAVERLRQHTADSVGTRFSPFEMSDDIGDTIPASPEAPKPSVLDLLSEGPGLTDLPDEIAQTLRDEGGDPNAPGGHQIELIGELAGILALSEADMQKPPRLARARNSVESDSLVAGARNQRYLRLVEQQIPKLAA